MVKSTAAEKYPLAVLHFVPGEPLDPAEPGAPEIMGDMLGRIQRILISESYHPPTPEGLFGYLLEDTGTCEAYPALSTQITRSLAAIQAFEQSMPVTYGAINHEGPELLRDAMTGAVGAIDWGVIYWGPLIYTVALSILRLRDKDLPGDAFLRHYLANSPMHPRELDGMPAYMAASRAMGAKFLASCLVSGQMRGLTDPGSTAQRMQKWMDDTDLFLGQCAR
ncbi:MAG TPA: hypothetical protein VGK87_07310 [Anaerolineae bacterium]